ncbi:MAG: hypothetical protein IT361_11010 [Gemmatimonadaceae bacterium]|nr:hypothetical protein [Gemmatimonadaceae bacterium]
MTLTISCRDEVPSEPTARSVSSSVNAAAVQGEVPSGETVFAELSQKVPSASGFFFDTQGRIVVNVADPNDGPSAVLAVRALIDRRVIAVPTGTTVPVLWRQVKYNFAQLSRWRDLVFDSVFTSGPGIESLDLDEKNNVIRIGAQSSRVASAEGTARSLLARTGGDPSALVVVADAGLRPSFLPSIGYFTWTTLTANADTVVGGLAIGQNSPGWTCTIGFTAEHPTWGQGFVTASHCTSDIWNVDGRVANQAWGGTLAGTEVADPGPWNCGVLHLCRRSDAALFQRGAGKPLVRGLVARPSGIGQTGVNPSDPYFVVVGTSNGFMGQQVYKLGYWTGWTSGTVSYTCQDRNLTGIWPPGNIRTVRCTNESTNADHGGDSGGSIVLPVGGPYVFLAGTTVGPALNGAGTGWSTISQIQLDFGNTLNVTRATTLGAPTTSGSLVGSNPRISWPAVANASRYHVYSSTSSGGGAYTYLTETASTTFTDGSYTVMATSSSPPPAPWVAYYVVASAPGAFSPNGNTVYFQRPAAITATIEGQFEVRPNEGCYWTASASGGTGSYTYQWTINGQATGGNSSQLLYTNTGSSFTVGVTVTDGSSTPSVDSRAVSVSSGNPTCGF